MAYTHAAFAVAAAAGLINEPVFLGRRWGVGYMWTEAAVYSAASIALGYLGWGPESPRPHGQTDASPLGAGVAEPAATGSAPVFAADRR